jgi:hypothetical protein
MDVHLTCNEQYSKSFVTITNTFCRVADARVHVTTTLSEFVRTSPTEGLQQCGLPQCNDLGLPARRSCD